MDLNQPPVDSDSEIGAQPHSTTDRHINPPNVNETLKGRMWEVKEPPK